MEKPLGWRGIVLSDLAILILIALAKLIFHALTNGQYRLPSRRTTDAG